MNKRTLSIVALLGIFTLSACTDKKEAIRVLENDGFTNVKVTGYNFFACSKDDFYHTGFVGTKNNRRIKGTVCSGLIFKGSTIRY